MEIGSSLKIEPILGAIPKHFLNVYSKGCRLRQTVEYRQFLKAQNLAQSTILAYHAILSLPRFQTPVW